jgi:hypothetical protein
MTRQQIIQASYDFSKATEIETLVEKKMLSPGERILTFSGEELIYLKKVHLDLNLVRYSYFPEHFYLFSNLFGNEGEGWQFEKSLFCLKSSEKVLVTYGVFHETWETLTFEKIPMPEKDKILLVFDTSAKNGRVLEYYPDIIQDTFRNIGSKKVETVNMASWRAQTLGFNIFSIRKEKMDSGVLKFKVVDNPDK